MQKTVMLLLLTVLVGCAEKGISEKGGSGGTPLFMTRPQPMEPVELVFDKKYAGRKPENYRKSEELRISGSAMISPKVIKEIAKPVKKEKGLFYVFDLRQESHGFINDEPVTWQADRDWANAGLNHEEAVRRERRQLGDLRVGERINGVEIKSIETEESMVRSSGHQYVRLTVTDHVRPTDSEVDLFLEAVRALPERAWVHFHCRAGKGRTTTFMILFDMLVNARVDSFEAIVERNKNLSNDYDVLAVGEPSDWKHLYQKERADFVKEFYNYAKAHPRGEGLLWPEWIMR